MINATGGPFFFLAGGPFFFLVVAAGWLLGSAASTAGEAACFEASFFFFLRPFDSVSIAKPPAVGSADESLMPMKLLAVSSLAAISRVSSVEPFAAGLACGLACGFCFVAVAPFAGAGFAFLGDADAATPGVQESPLVACFFCGRAGFAGGLSARSTGSSAAAAGSVFSCSQPDKSPATCSADEYRSAGFSAVMRRMTSTISSGVASLQSFTQSAIAPGFGTVGLRPVSKYPRMAPSE